MTEVTDNKKFVSWDEFHRDAIQLADKIKEKYPELAFKGIVAVSRGGYIPATIIAHQLNIKNIRSISLSSYNKKNMQDKTIINDIFNTEETWLIIDELTDTGKTYDIIRKHHPNSIFGVVYAKPKGIPHINHYAVECPQDCWIAFPWEF